MNDIQISDSSLQKSFITTCSYLDSKVKCEREIVNGLGVRFWSREDMIDLLNTKKHMITRHPLGYYGMLASYPEMWSISYYGLPDNGKFATTGDSAIGLYTVPMEKLYLECLSRKFGEKLPSLSKLNPRGYLYVYCFKCVKDPGIGRTMKALLWHNIDKDPQEGDWGPTNVEFIQQIWKGFPLLEALKNPSMVIDFLRPILQRDYRVPGVRYPRGFVRNGR
jgi:hypothetical protein